MRLFPRVGTLSTAAGRAAVLATPFDRAPGAPSTFTVGGWSSVPLADDADPFGVDPSQTTVAN